MSDISIVQFFEQVRENREKWLDDNGVIEASVLRDDSGEYILSETDNGNPGEDGYDVRVTKTYLPDEITLKALDIYGI